MRAVLDTNVLVSTLYSKSGPIATLREAIKTRRFEICLSDGLLRELEQVLARPRFATALNVSDSVAVLLEELAAAGTFPSRPIHIVPVVPEDPADDVIVTGDRALLSLRHHQGLPIVTPRVFLDMLAVWEEGVA